MGIAAHIWLQDQEHITTGTGTRSNHEEMAEGLWRKATLKHTVHPWEIRLRYLQTSCSVNTVNYRALSSIHFNFVKIFDKSTSKDTLKYWQLSPLRCTKNNWFALRLYRSRPIFVFPRINIIIFKARMRVLNLNLLLVSVKKKKKTYVTQPRINVTRKGNVSWT